MRELLRDYIAIDTSYPTCHYDDVIALFTRHADQDGFATRRIDLPSGFPALIITKRGTNTALGALALNQHMDVVPAHKNEGWITDPFTLTEKNGELIGRGTQDMKGVGITHYAALSQLCKETELKRTVHLILVPDEERGGFLGMKELMNHPDFAKLSIEYVLDEGVPSGDDTTMLIKISERTPVQVKLTYTGTSAHGSFLNADNPIHGLLECLEVFKIHHNESRSRAQTEPAGSQPSFHVTSLYAGSPDVLNKVPAEAVATLDIRIPSDQPLSVAHTLLDELITQHPNLSYKVMATSEERMPLAPITDTFYQAVEQAITTCGYQPKPFYFEATTDSRFYTHKGIKALGLSPFRCKPNLHGVNESITTTDLSEGIKVMKEIIKNICT